MNTDFARRQMVEQQVRTWDVDDAEILATMTALSRNQFVPPMYADLAYADTEIPLSHGQYMLRPTIEGRALHALDLDRRDNVLEVGTGTGYLTACIGGLGGSVTSIDIFEDFLATAEKNLAIAGIENANLHCMDALEQLPAGEFDAILVSGSTPTLHERFIESLKPGGRLFAVVGESPVRSAVRITRGTGDGWQKQSLFETDIPELVNAQHTPLFSF